MRSTVLNFSRRLIDEVIDLSERRGAQILLLKLQLEQTRKQRFAEPIASRTIDELFEEKFR